MHPHAELESILGHFLLCRDDIDLPLVVLDRLLKATTNKGQVKSNQIKSNLFASTKYKRKTVEKHKVNTHKKTTTYRLYMNASRTQRQRDCSYMSPKE